MSSLHPGDRLDHYRIDSLVARSGMASIYRATDTRTGRAVAIKLPHPEMEADPIFFDRFHREEEIGKKLDHPGVVKVLNDEERSRRALDYIHSQGVVHRDLKPENIMVDAEDRIKLIDFGIAANAGSRRLTFAKLTEAMGTPDYISPEQVKGKRGDARSDIYTLGIMFYEMLTGKVPFTGPNPFVTMNERLINHPIPPREVNPEITPELQEIIYRALERDPKKRYASAREFALDLEHPEKVGVADRDELQNWRQRRSPVMRRVLFYIMLALIPVVVFGLMLFVAHHK